MAAVTLVWGQGEDDGIHLENGEEEVGREDDEGADEQGEAWMPCTHDGRFWDASLKSLNTSIHHRSGCAVTNRSVRLTYACETSLVHLCIMIVDALALYNDGRAKRERH